MSNWIRIDDHVKEIESEPWSLYWHEWKSVTQEFEDFLHNPLPVLEQEIVEVQSDWHVTTEVINHEIGLVSNAVCKLAMIIPSMKTVKIMFFKH